MNREDKSLNVSVVYALPEIQEQIQVKCYQGATIINAIQDSGILSKYPEIDLDVQQVGIYGYRYGLDHPLQDGDRIEIYRPLHVSPTEARRLRAKASQKSKNIK